MDSTETSLCLVLKRMFLETHVRGRQAPWTARLLMDDYESCCGSIRIEVKAALQKLLTGAAANGHLKVARLLWQTHKELCNPGKAIIAAAANGHCDLVDFLQDKCTRENIGAALIAAAGNGHVEVLRQLPVNEYSKTIAIREAALNGHIQVLKFFFQGSEVNTLFPELFLVKAAEGGHIDVIKFVLSTGAVGIGSMLALRALSAAVMNGHIDATKLILEQCGQVEIALAVELAASNNLVVMLGVLLEEYEPYSTCFEEDNYIEVGQSRSAGVVNPEVAVSQALYLAVSENRVEVVKLLVGKSYTCIVGAAMSKAAACGFYEIASVLANNVQDCTLHGTLSEAAKQGWEEVLAVLNQADENGFGAFGSALAEAATHGHIDIVKLLIVKSEECVYRFNQHLRAVGDSSWMAKSLGHDLQLIIIGRAFIAAAEVGHLEILKLLPMKKAHPRYLHDAMKKARECGHDAVVDWLSICIIALATTYRPS
ncbi:unnamed protein product [Phytophthora lilii]|uniref:Unnamed protein product n=1 Tax=Phytophthora lilii TaxID=2077276 RepID=A0A9W6TRQ8_9STRA|nr:unnamed protein product [Phytophthora lilii]